MKTPESPTSVFDPQRIRAITLDLDDTLWPIWPTIARAEGVLQRWLDAHAPATAALGRDKDTLRAVRNQMQTLRPDLAHDMSGLRRESIRLLLQRAGDDPALAEPAFEVFFAERQRVDLFEDALPALEFLASRFPLVALSNGNADIHRVGLGAHFRASISAREFGVAKRRGGGGGRGSESGAAHRRRRAPGRRGCVERRDATGLVEPRRSPLGPRAAATPHHRGRPVGAVSRFVLNPFPSSPP